MYMGNRKTLSYDYIIEVNIHANQLKNANKMNFLSYFMPCGKFTISVEEEKKLSQPINYDYLNLMESSYNYLRKYTLILLEFLESKTTKRVMPVLLALL